MLNKRVPRSHRIEVSRRVRTMLCWPSSAKGKKIRISGVKIEQMLYSVLPQVIVYVSGLF